MGGSDRRKHCRLGVVHFWGIVGSEEQQRALRIAAENTPGVRGIEDHTILGSLYSAM
jgi:hypothetical protein